MSKNIERAIIIIMVCGLILTGVDPISILRTDNGPGSAPTTHLNFPDYMGFNVAAANSGIYFVEELNDSANRFVNQVDGYSISIPKEMKVVDMSLPGIRSVLEDEHRKIEIYKEIFDNGLSGYTYVNYSNRFLANRSDHRHVSRQQLNRNGRSLNVVQWSREKLENLKNDKNYYACVDIMEENAVYTFFFKSDVPLDECGGYMDIIEEFHTFTSMKQAGSAQFKHVQSKKWNSETTAAFEKYFSADSRLKWGVFEPSAPLHMENLQELEQKLDYEFPIILLYSQVREGYDPYYVGQALRNAYAHGKIVELTLQTSDAGEGKNNMVYEILDGKHDEFLRAYAQDVVEFGHPVLFRPFNEMNGDWCTYSAYHTSRDTDIFKELYQYVYSIFEEAGADNVIWVWNPNEKSFPDFKWNNELMYYPGDKYVDVVGLTGYNTGTYYNGETWRSFQEIYDPLYQRAVALYDKPLMITEFASSSVSLSKEQWVANMFSCIDNYPNIKVAIWWDGRDLDSQGNIARPYFIDETDELVTIFKENLGNYK